MANNVLKAKNSFSGGLVMDLAPDNTLNTVLTDALNGTFITYNGNEWSLLQDMGNGRVETAFLPQGYIPIGTCSFGGIIYIVSYNPLEDKSLIGCFPSPERNIETEEINEFNPILTVNELTKDGVVNKYSTKKLLTSENLNPGDKFVIHWNDNGLNTENKDDNTNFHYISNFGNTYKVNNDPRYEWPKLVKIQLIAIEDSGKINYLDSTTLWYDYTNNGPYFINTQPHTEVGEVDLDDYRNAVSGNYSVFQSKVSGKLALLIELEKISSFSAAYKVVPTNTIINNKRRFNIYLSTSWDTENKNINPSGFIIESNHDENITIIEETTEVEYNLNYQLNAKYNTDSEFFDNSYYNKVNDYNNVQSVELEYNGLIPLETYTIDGSSGHEITDDIIVHRFDKQVLKQIGIVDVPMTQTGTEITYSGVYSYTVTPYMPYGKLTDLKQSGIIDFSEWNSTIQLTNWKYYVDTNSLTLTWGLKTALNPILQVTKLSITFYDYLGKVAIYEAKDYESYNGAFTEYIALNTIKGNSNISNNSCSHFGAINDINSVDLSEYRITPKEVLSYQIYYNNTLIYPTNSVAQLNILPENAYGETGLYLINPTSRSGSATATLLGTNLYRIDYTESSISKSITDQIAASAIYKLDPTKFYLLKNDAGMLRYGKLYLAKIEINYQENGTDLAPIVYNRWLWNNGILNQYYSSTSDFIELPLKLNISSNVSLDGRQIVQNTTEYYSLNLSQDFSESDNYKSLGALILSVGYNSPTTHSLNRLILKTSPGLANEGNLALNTDKYDKINVKIATARPSISLLNKNGETVSELTHVYGDSNKTNNDFLNPVIATDELNDTTYTPVITEFPKYTSSIFQSKNNELYSNNTNYLNFKDWFTLLLYETDGTKNFTYIDSNEETQTVHQSYIEKTANLTSLQGINLSFKGIRFNKLYAYKSTLSRQCNVLKSLLYNISDLEKYNLAYNDGLYFKDIICISMARNEDSNGWIGFYIDRFSDIKTSTNTLTVNSGWSGNDGADAWYTAGTSNKGKYTSISKILSLTGSISDYGFIPMIFTGLIHGNGKGIEALGISTNTSEGLNGWKNIDSTYGDRVIRHTNSKYTNQLVGYPNKESSPRKNSDGSWTINNSYRHLPTTLALTFDVNNVGGVTTNLYPINNFHSNYIFNTGLSQELKWKSPYSGPNSYADMIGSFLGQIYVKDPTAVYNSYLLENIVTLEENTELWKKDIIIECDLSNATEDDLKEMVLVEGIKLSSHINKLKQISSTSNIDLRNVTPFTKLVENGASSEIVRDNIHTQCLEFKYTADYNISKIKDAYENNMATSNILFDFTNGNKAVQIENDVQDNILYTYNGTTIEELNEGSVFYNLTISPQNTSTLAASKSTEELSINLSCTSIRNTIIYKNNRLRINPNNLSNTGTLGGNYSLDFTSNSDADDNSVTHLEGMNAAKLFNYTFF